MVEIYGLELGIFDMGWPSAAAVAYNTSVGAFIIPVCLGANPVSYTHLDVYKRQEVVFVILQHAHHRVLRRPILGRIMGEKTVLLCLHYRCGQAQKN